MVTFKNNNNYRRGRFRNNDRGYKRGGDNSKFKSDYSVSSNFQRKIPGRNNHNASKLIDKYTDLAREALANEDKILSENYFQHADHFTRVQNEQESNRIARINSSPIEAVKTVKAPVEVVKTSKNEELKKNTSEIDTEKMIKTT